MVLHRSQPVVCSQSQLLQSQVVLPDDGLTEYGQLVSCQFAVAKIDCLHFHNGSGKFDSIDLVSCQVAVVARV